MAIDLPNWLNEVIALAPDADVLQFEGRWRPWSWLTAGTEVLRIRLDNEGFGDGAMVGVVMRNRPEIVRTIAASLATRRCLVTLSSAIPPEKLASEIRRLRLPVVVATATDWATGPLRSAVTEAGSLGLVANDGADANDGDDHDDPFGIIVASGDRGGAPTTAVGVAVQMLTSGTTGPPKRIDLLYRSLEHEIESTAHYSRNADMSKPRLSSGTSLIWNPLLHIGGLRGLMTSLVAGRKVALLERFSVDGWAAMVGEHRPRVISLVPAAMAMVYDADLPKDLFAGVEVAFSGTAPLDPTLGRQFEERYGVPVLVVYGATEFAGGVAGWTIGAWKQFGDAKSGSVGRPNAGVDVRIVDRETGTVLPSGQVGLLEVRAPQLATEGWTRTTDLARIDDDRFIWIIGRADDVIIRGGFKVATGEVRDIIASHPSVSDACVIGLDDTRLGQVPVAAVELRAGAAITSADLLAWARDRLSGYQVPVEIKIVDLLPRTPSMKVSQGDVRLLFGPTRSG